MRWQLTTCGSFVKNISPFTNERTLFGPKSRYREEMLLRFDSAEARDATNLAGKGLDFKVRLVIPNHLKGGQ